MEEQDVLQNEAAGQANPSPQSLPTLTDEESVRKQVCDYLAHQIQPKKSSMVMKKQSYPIDFFPFRMMILVEKVKETHQMWDIRFPDTSDKTHPNVLLGKLEPCGPVGVQLGHWN